MPPQTQQASAALLVGLMALTSASRAAAVLGVAASAAPGSAPPTDGVLISAVGGRVGTAAANTEAAGLLRPSISEFAQTMNKRLERDVKAMGRVARHLRSLNNGTDEIAEDVLGKAYDMHSLQSFLSEHAVAMKEHEQLGEEVARLSSLVSSLEHQTKTLQNMTGHEEASAEEAARKRDHAKSIVALDRSNALLREQNEQVTLDLENIAKDVEEIRANTSMKRNATDSLEAVVLEQHKYAEECNRQAGHYESQLATYEGLLAAVHSRGGRVMKVADMTNKVHGIVQEKNAALKARIDKALANIGTIQTQTLTTRAQQEQFEKQSQAELAKLGQELGAQRTKIEDAKTELKFLKLQRQAELRRLEVAKAEVEKFQKALLSGEIAKMHSNNTQLKATLQQAHDTMQGSQAAVVKFEAEITQANQTLSVLRKGAEDSLQEAEKLAQDALARIVAAKQQGEEAVARAKEATMKAETASLENCNATWDKRHRGLLRELKKCSFIELELKTVRAQVEALTNTISASQAQEQAQATQ